MMDQLRGYTVNGTPNMMDSPTMLDTPSMTMMTADLGASTSSSIHFAPRPSASSSSSSSRPQPPRDGGGGGNIIEEDEASSSMSASSSPTSSRAGSPSRRPSHARRQQRRDGGGGSSPTMMTTSAPVPAAVQNAVSAFSTAGKKRADGRRGGGGGGGGGGTGERSGDGQPSPPDSPTTTTTMTTATTTNTRKVLNPDEYPDTPAFRQVDQVLRRVQEEWPNLVRGPSLATAAGAANGRERGQEEADLAFDPVSLALELLEPDRSARGGDHHATSRRQNLTSFLRLKAELDNAIKSTLSPRMNPTTLESGAGADAYRAYETAITTHNATHSTLTHAQRLVGGMRTGLVTTRERLEGQLGAKEGGLAGMYARLGMLEEMGSLLDEM